MNYSQLSRPTQNKQSAFTPVKLALAVLPASIMLAISSGNVFAQEQEAESSGLAIEEVVVTAQRREQNLQDVPIAISAFTSDAIEKNMFGDVSEYVTQTPNASYISNGARSRRQISIRGVTSFAGTGTTGFYLDDFSVAASTINPPILDIERIEVLRGPQATYFGRNAMGGGINVTSKKPTNEFEGSAMLDYSSFNTIDAEGIVNVPLIADTLAMRFNLKSVTSDGNIRNINATGGGNDSDYQYVKGSVRYTPTDQLTVDFTMMYASEDVGMREGVPSGVFSDFAGNVLYAGQFPDRDGDGKSDPFIDTVGFYPSNQDRVNFNTPQNVGTNMRSSVLKIDYEHNDLLFTNVTGYIDSDFFLNGDIDGSSLDFFNEFGNSENESFSSEFRVQNTDSGPAQWNLGVIFAEDKGTQTSATYVGAEELFGLPDGFKIDGDDGKTKADTWAIFGQADIDVTDRWTASVGGRYSEETKSEDFIGFGGALVTILNVKDTFTDFSPRIAATFEANEYTTWYGTISKGFKSGGVQVAPNPEAETYDPESLWNYEIGMKADLFDQRVRINAAVFYMDWTDLQVSFQESLINENGDFVIFGGVTNAEAATSKGAEISSTILVSDHLIVNLNVGYLDAKFDDFAAFIDGANYTLDGLTIPNSPEWTASANAEYDFNYTANWAGYVRLEWNYRDEIKPNTTSLIYTGFPWDVPSYNYFNLRVGAEYKNIRLVGYVENLLDEEYYTNAYQKAFAGGLFIEPSYQRFGIRATYEF
jgi:iron complex outermembrane receptor protein